MRYAFPPRTFTKLIRACICTNAVALQLKNFNSLKLPLNLPKLLTHHGTKIPFRHFYKAKDSFHIHTSNRTIHTQICIHRAFSTKRTSIESNLNTQENPDSNSPRRLISTFRPPERLDTPDHSPRRADLFK